MRDSVRYLVGRAGELALWTDVEALGIAAYDDGPDSSAQAFCHHIQTVRNELARQLWANHVFVGSTVLDGLLFNAVRAGHPDPVLSVLEVLRDSRSSMRSLVLFPLQSLGIMAGGLLMPFRRATATIVDAGRGIAITPQTNDLGRTVKFLASVAPELKVRREIDQSLIEHWYRSRGARWLEKNPLLVVGVRSISGYYYENEFLHMGRVRSVTTAIALIASLQPRNSDARAYTFSSSRINNWETRDIHHYAILSGSRGKYVDGRTVPIHQREEIDELSSLPIDLNPRHWSRARGSAARIYAASDALFNGYLRHSVGNRNEDAVGRTYRKVFDAVSYFRRSLGDDWSSVVSLATAFEMILTDQYEPKVTARLQRRTRLLLQGVAGTRAYQDSVVDLYDARSALVHRGEATTMDLRQARAAFAHVFLAIMSRMPSLGPKVALPMQHLTGDSS